MDSWIALLGKIAVIGVGATAVMDVWLLLLKKFDIPALNFALLGRWVGHVFRGKWFHDGIAKATPIQNELAVGWLAHYSIGIGFAALPVVVFGIDWLINPTFISSVSIGIATVIAPLFIMQPAMGSGIASSKTAMPMRNCIKSFINHAVFGCGIYVAAILLRWI